MRAGRRRGGGCGLLLALALGAAVGARFGWYPFLARHAPVPADLLVVEGWLSDDLLRQAAGWAESNGVRKIVATGGPLETGSPLVEWRTGAEMTKARLERLGLGDRFELAAAPAERVRRDRTRESARALKAALGPEERKAFNVASAGPHARRSWRAFRGEFGAESAVGSVALTPVEYAGDDWWTCSEGVRSVVDETVAWLYDALAAPAAGR